MPQLYNVATGELLGSVSDDSIQFLIDQLEEEDTEDRDYYVNTATVDIFATQGAPSDLLELLRTALATRPEMDIRWDG